MMHRPEDRSESYYESPDTGLPRDWFPSNKYSPSRSQALMHVLALELLRLSK